MSPPWVVAVVYASIAQIAVGELFAAMLFPSLIMVGLFIVYIIGVCVLKPGYGPAADGPDMYLPITEKLKVNLSGLVPPMLLIFAVLGSFMTGIASPTEAAAVGAGGALILCISYGKFSLKSAEHTSELPSPIR